MGTGTLWALQGGMLVMPGLVLSQRLTSNLPVWPPGAVLTHGCLRAPAHTLHLPCARGCLDLLLHMQPAVCTGPPPAGLSLPAVALLLPAPAPQPPSPPRKAALRGLWDSPGLHLHTQPALPPKGWVGIFRGRRYILGFFGPGCDGFKASWWDGRPKGQVFWHRGGHSHAQLSPIPNPHGFFYSLPEFTHYPHESF